MVSRDSHSGRSRRTFIKTAGVAGAAGLAGCSGLLGNGDSSGTELQYQTLFVGGDGEIMKNIIDQFNEEQPFGDITINRQRSPWEEYYNQLFTQMSGGNPPDIAISHAAYIPRFQESLVELDDYVSDEMDNYVDQILNSTIIDGTQYAIPMDSHPVGLYYNQDILDQVGAEPPFESFEEFESACNAIRDETDADAFGPGPVDGLNSRNYYSSVAALGGDLFNEDKTEAIFDEGAGLEAAQYYYSVSGERGWDQPDTSEERVIQSFLNGSIAFMMNGTWGVADMADVDFTWGMTKPRVTPNAEEVRAATDSHTLIVPQQSDADEERVQTIVDIIEWITQEHPEWGTEAGHLPAYNPILEGDTLQESDLWDKTLQNYTEMAQDGQLAYFPQLGSADFYDTSNWNWLVDMYGHNITPEEAVANGIETWNDTLGSN